jgi:adenine C2-methylase RlmN of 23S rRNA A2503 and tRNA A37
MGLRGDLSSGEILEQLLHAMAIAPIRNIVFMGQGEVRVVKLYM